MGFRAVAAATEVAFSHVGWLPLFLWGSDDRGQLGRKLSEHGQKFVSTPSQPVACSVGASVSCCAQGLGAVNMD
jgi:alpha-tubulin suppressor-like RCC1 family protein